MRAFLAAAMVLGAMTSPAFAQEDYRLLRIDGNHLKWGAPRYGAGAEVSYGFADRFQSFPDAVNCREIAPIDRLAEVLGAERARIERIAAAAFSFWSSAAGIRFRPAGPDETPDILIGTQAVPRGVAWANVWHDETAADGQLATMNRASVCFNPEESWSVDAPASPGVYDLLTVLAHEIGHAIGLDHPGASGALMGFQNQGPLPGLLAGDVRGAIALYGPSR